MKVDELQRLLIASQYNPEETTFLVNGFREGFSIGYERSDPVKLTSHNLKLNIGNEVILWNKVMKEVGEGRYAGPFEEIPFEDDYIQSPIGLVPKDGGRECRLIFHLSYPRNGKDSVNTNTPHELCTVNYVDFDEAIKLCLKEGKCCKLGKTGHKISVPHTRNFKTPLEIFDYEGAESAEWQVLLFCG